MIRFQRPELPPATEIERYYRAAEDARWFSNFGPCHELLTERLERRLGGGLHVVPLANCTLGLALGLRALVGERRDGEVVVPSFTFAATAAAVTWCGLRPVFVDVDPDAWMLDPAMLGDALAARGDRVAAVLACSTFGAPPPDGVVEAWEAAAAAAGVPLLVDSAAGFGARRADGAALGRAGDAEVFSLHATKPFAIGEGGLLCTADADLAQRVRRLANFGLEGASVTGPIGLNAKLAEWPAATALAVLDRLDDVLARRRQHAAAMRSATASAGLTFQRVGGESTWQFVPALAPSAGARADVLREAQAAGVEVRTYFDPPLHRMPAFADAPVTGDLAVTEDLSARALSLPMANDLSSQDVAAIAAAVAAGVSAGGRT